MKKRALVTGISGQDGAYLAKLLLDKGYEVYGFVSRRVNQSFENLDYLGITNDIKFTFGDITDPSSINHALHLSRPHEVYNLAAMSHVKVSFDTPEYTANIDSLGTLRLLESLRKCKIDISKIKFYQASTSEMFGKVQEVPQTENTPFYPRSPYSVAKLYSHWITKNYRESYNMLTCSGIIFNHESPRRGHNFVTTKITIAL